LAEKKPQFNEEAERTVLGAGMIDAGAVAAASSLLSPDDFFLESHKRIFRAQLGLFSKSVPIDLVTLKNELDSAKDLVASGGAGYLAGLLDGLPRVTNVEQWARIIKNKATVRRLRQAANSIADMCDEPEDSQVLADAALAEILTVVQGAGGDGGWHSATEVVKAAGDRLEMIARQDIVGIKTKIDRFDQLTFGLVAPRLVVIAGRPGEGKTAAALTIADNAVDQGYTVGMFSLEMDHDELGVRALAKRAGWSPKELRSRPERWESFTLAMDSLMTKSFFVEDDPFLTMPKVLARARQLKAQHGLDLLIVDYLQLLHGEEKRRYDGRQNEVASIARGLKNLAKALQVPVIALSQLSRDSVKRTDKKPQLSDLRESGEIEQAADIVVLLHRPYAYDPESNPDPTKAEWIVAKHRNGPTDRFNVYYDPAVTAFANPKPVAA
jgi:replicative DNA helicase